MPPAFGPTFNFKTIAQQVLPLLLLVVGSAAGLSLPADASGLANVAWPVFRHDLKNTGQSQHNTSANAGRLKWKFQTGAPVYSSPAIGRNDTIYVSSNGILYAVTPRGSLKWECTADIGSSVSSPAISADGTIYVGMYKTLYAVGGSGSLKWAFPTSNAMDSSPAIGAGGTIYIGSNDGYVYAVNPNGGLKWELAMTGGDVPSFSSPAIGGDGTIYIGSNGGHLYAVTPRGSLKWMAPANNNAGASSPAIGSDGTIYVGSSSVTPKGRLKWEFPTGNNSMDSSAAIGRSGIIYLNNPDGHLYALDKNRAVKWAFAINQTSASSPAVGTDGSVYVGASDGIYAISRTGTLKWKFPTTGIVVSSPAIGTDGTVYIGTSDGFLYALGQ